MGRVTDAFRKFNSGWVLFLVERTWYDNKNIFSITTSLIDRLGAGWSSNNAFGVIGGSNRPNASRPVMIRMLVCQACKQMTISSPLHGSNGFHSVEAVLHQVEQMKPGNETPIQLKEMLDICDTEGNIQNGGGSFIIQTHEPGGTFVKFEAGGNLNNVSRSGGGPGDIGSPVQQSGSLMAAFGGPRPFQAPGSIMTPTGF